MSFCLALSQHLTQFSPYLSQDIAFSSPVFTTQKGKVSDYVNEILETANHIAHYSQSTTTEPDSLFYTQHYSTLLVEQFSQLQQRLKALKKVPISTPIYRSKYTFSKNIHNLPPEKRLKEYQKALRSLNEKLVWLTEQCYLAEDSQRAYFQGIIEETEYRKQKCLAAIAELEG